MDEIEQKLEISRRRVFINSLMSTITDIVVLVILVKTGTEANGGIGLPLLLIMGLVMVLHGRTVLFQMSYVPQYLSDWLHGRTARQMIEEAIAEAGLSYDEVAADITGSETGFTYLGEKYMYFFYVDRIYIFPRQEIVWLYFTGWRLMTRMFHWQMFYLPHIGLRNGEVHAIVGYVFNRDEYEKLVAARGELLPRVVFGYSAALDALYHGARDKFLALCYQSDAQGIPAAERERLLSEVEPPERQPRRSMFLRTLKGVGSVLILLLLVFLAQHLLKGN